MRQKLEDCQKFRASSYNHTGGFVEGNKVWFQPLNGTSWLGLAAVVCQMRQSVLLHNPGDLKKVSACQVKPFKLVDRTSIVSNPVSEERRVITEGGL